MHNHFPLIITPAAINDNDSYTCLHDYLLTHRDEVFQHLHQHAALLFSGFQLNTVEQFETLAKLITPDLKNYVGGDSKRSKLSEKVYTSTDFPPNFPIPMHNELSYSNHYPSILYFFCETPPAAGGETPLLNARKLYQALSPQLIEKFQQKKLMYVTNLHNGIGVGKSWQETFETNDKAEVTSLLEQSGTQYEWLAGDKLRLREIVTPIVTHPITGEIVFFSQADQWHPSHLDADIFTALKEIMPETDFYHHCYFADGSPLDPADLAEIRAIVKRETICFPWHKGDLLIIDNLLALHGRNPFQGPRAIRVAMG